MAHVSGYVVIWLVLALLGVALTVPALAAAIKDDAVVRGDPATPPEQRIVNRGMLRNAVGRAVVKATFFAVGVETLLAELGWRIPHFGPVFAWQLIAALAILDALSIIDWAQRDQLADAYEARMENRAQLAKMAALEAAHHREAMDSITDTNERTRDVQTKAAKLVDMAETDRATP